MYGWINGYKNIQWTIIYFISFLQQLRSSWFIIISQFICLTIFLRILLNFAWSFSCLTWFSCGCLLRGGNTTRNIHGLHREQNVLILLRHHRYYHYIPIIVSLLDAACSFVCATSISLIQLTHFFKSPLVGNQQSNS